MRSVSCDDMCCICCCKDIIMSVCCFMFCCCMSISFCWSSIFFSNSSSRAELCDDSDDDDDDERFIGESTCRCGLGCMICCERCVSVESDSNDVCLARLRYCVERSPVCSAERIDVDDNAGDGMLCVVADVAGEYAGDREGDRGGKSSMERRAGCISNILYVGRYCGHVNTLCSVLLQQRHCMSLLHARDVCPEARQLEQKIVFGTVWGHFDRVCSRSKHFVHIRTTGDMYLRHASGTWQPGSGGMFARWCSSALCIEK
jgi:hypothetical protein